jgi:WD40 repeat protein
VTERQVGTNPVAHLAGQPHPLNLCFPTASGDGLLKLWDLKTLVCLRDFRGHTSAVYSCALSASGELAVSGALDGTVKVWRVGSGEELCSFTMSDGLLAVMTVSFSPDGARILAGSADKTAVIWDLASSDNDAEFAGEVAGTLAGHRLAINAAVFSFDGESVVTGSSDTTVKIWRLATFKDMKTLTGHKAAVMAVDVTRDGSLVCSASQDHTVRVWSAQSAKVRAPRPRRATRAAEHRRRAPAAGGDRARLPNR